MGSMAITILTSIQDSFGYYNNLGYLRSGLGRKEGEEGRIQFQGFAGNHAPEAIVFDDKGRVYDFTRSASSRIKEDMTTYLGGVLPGLAEEDRRRIREAFGPLYNYYAYKGYLDEVGQERHESMYMLIFNAAQQYVAHVHLSGTSRRTAPRQYSINVALTCHCYTYFPIQDTNFLAFLQALENLHV